MSDKDTLHIFDTSPLSASSNRRHVLSKFPLLPRYFSGEWSFVQAHLAEERTRNGAGGVIGWASEDCVEVIWPSEGRVERYAIKEKEGNTGGIVLQGNANANGGMRTIGTIGEAGNEKWELVRDSWRKFEDV